MDRTFLRLLRKFTSLLDGELPATIEAMLDNPRLQSELVKRTTSLDICALPISGSSEISDLKRYELRGDRVFWMRERGGFSAYYGSKSAPLPSGADSFLACPFGDDRIMTAFMERTREGSRRLCVQCDGVTVSTVNLSDIWRTPIDLTVDDDGNAVIAVAYRERSGFITCSLNTCRDGKLVPLYDGHTVYSFPGAEKIDCLTWSRGKPVFRVKWQPTKLDGKKQVLIGTTRGSTSVNVSEPLVDAKGDVYYSISDSSRGVVDYVNHNQVAQSTRNFEVHSVVYTPEGRRFSIEGGKDDLRLYMDYLPVTRAFKEVFSLGLDGYRMVVFGVVVGKTVKKMTFQY